LVTILSSPFPVLQPQWASFGSIKRLHYSTSGVLWYFSVFLEDTFPLTIPSPQSSPTPHLVNSFLFF
jgi:hypothetical protein